ncbi:MAG: glycosyltransferase family 1 protein [Bryobacter sp.]|nr:glycosyltransferase family 1 protein [Bryobacter sp.]
MKFALFLGNAGKNSGGMEVYEMELVRGLMKIDQRNDYHVYCMFPGGPAKIGPAPPNFTYHVLQPQSQVMSIAMTLPLALRWLRPDAVHSTFVPPLFVPPRMAYTLPCSAVFEHPQMYPFAIRMRLLALCGLGVQKAGAVVCVSQHVREYLMENKGVPADRLPVTPLGVNRGFRPQSSAEIDAVVKNKYGIHSPYYLYSGRWEARKNVVRLVEAFGQFKREDRTGMKLVMTGERNWLGEVVDAKIREHGLEQDVIDVGKSPLGDLPPLYAGATALVFPSLWESFGLPLVEAMKCGTPVISSNLSCIPEVAGDAAVLVNPYETEEIAAAMHRVSVDAPLRSRMQAAGLKRAERYDWNITAAKTLEVYERLASRS